jgi:hypothetical protein
MPIAVRPVKRNQNDLAEHNTLKNNSAKVLLWLEDLGQTNCLRPHGLHILSTKHHFNAFSRPHEMSKEIIAQNARQFVLTSNWPPWQSGISTIPIDCFCHLGPDL